MFKAITAYSTQTESADIVRELTEKSNLKLGIYRPKTGILYSSCSHDTEKLAEIIEGICRSFPGIELIGGTAIGGFTEDSGYIKDGYFLCMMVSDTILLRTGRLENLSKILESNNFSQAFSAYFAKYFPGEDPAACFLYSAYKVDGNKVIEEVGEALPKECLIFGGMATDYWTKEDIANASNKVPPNEKTLLFHAKDGVINITDDTLVFLMFQGDITVKYDVSYGWSDMGILYPGRGEGADITELNGQPPQTFFRELNHPLASEENSNLEYALWFHVPGKDPFLRDIFFNKATGRYHTEAASLPSQFQVSFSFPTRENVLKEFKDCLNKLGGQHDLAIATICCTHQVVLDQQISEECREMSRLLNQSPIIGGYVFGEFGPSATEKTSMLHSCSGVIISLNEASENHDVKNNTFHTFLDGIIREQRQEIQSLQKQLRFFEGSKYNKVKALTEDCLGMLLNKSHKSISSHAEQISKSLKVYYEKSGIEPPYAISRNRLIEHLMYLKKRARKITKVQEKLEIK